MGGARETPREAGTGRWAVGLSWRPGEPDGEKRGWKAKVGAEVPREQPPRWRFSAGGSMGLVHQRDGLAGRLLGAARAT